MNLNDQFGAEKIFRHLDRVAEWQKGTLPPPVTIEFNVTDSCNHSCPGCTFSYIVNISKESIPFDLAIRVIDEVKEIGVKAVTFSGGGEPLVYGQDKVLVLAHRVFNLGMEAALITNGSLLTDPRFLEYCSWVRVSLDGYDAETFARFHGRKEGEFAKVCNRLRLFCAEAAERRKRGERTATVGAGFLTTRDSLRNGHFEHMAEFCAREFPGLDYLQFRPLVVNMVDDPGLTGGGWETFTELEGAATETACIAARGRYQRDDFKVLWSAGKYQALAQPNFGKTYHACLGHFLEAVIAADAKVYICCHTQGQEKFCLGDLRQNSFAEIWHSDRAREVYESFDPVTTCPPACRLHLQNRLLQELSRPMVHENFI